MGERLALVISATNFADDELARLQAPDGDAAELTQILRSPDVGGFTVETLINASSSTVLESMERLFGSARGRSDQLLLYLSTHGVKDLSGRLYFACSNSRTDRLVSTAIPARTVHDLMDSCPAAAQVLVLDCCFSGAVMDGVKSTGSLRDSFSSGRGRVVLTSSDAFQYSFEDRSLDRHRSRYTGALIDGLRSGDADLDHDGVITTDELHDYAVRRLRDHDSAQSPLRWNFGNADPIVIAKRTARPQPGEPTPTRPSLAPPPPVGAQPGRRRNRRVLAIAVAVMVALAVAAGLGATSLGGSSSAPPASSVPSTSGSPGPSITLDTLETKPVTSRTELMGLLGRLAARELPEGEEISQFSRLATTSGSMTIELPAQWSETGLRTWFSTSDVPQGLKALSSPDESRFLNEWDTAGFGVMASSSLAEAGYEPAQTIAAMEGQLDGNCLDLGGNTVATETAHGAYNLWYDCGPPNTITFVYSAAHAEYITEIYARITTMADVVALDHVLSTFRPMAPIEDELSKSDEDSRMPIGPSRSPVQTVTSPANELPRIVATTTAG